MQKYSKEQDQKAPQSESMSFNTKVVLSTQFNLFAKYCLLLI